jgi:transcriptional regulator with XRE-family HTH domain
MGDLRVEVGQRLREARESAGLTHEAVASRLGLTRVAYGDFERGRTLIGLDHLLAVCQILERPITWFMGVAGDSAVAGLGDLTQEVVELMQGLPERERWAILTYARFVAEQTTHASEKPGYGC